MSLESGAKIGRYKIVSLLGKGGMGEVYQAFDPELERHVALKLLRGDVGEDKERMQRFKQEAKAASALNHPNIITIYEVGEDNGTHYIASEFIDGETLGQLLKNESFTLEHSLHIAEQTAAALGAAHDAGIVHRDIKPDNVMVRRDGIVKVVDFGLVKLTEKPVVDKDAETRAMVHTSPGFVMGTVNYMSPEQARGKGLDQRTDVWSLGVVIYQMVTRILPFEGESNSDVIASILVREPQPLSMYAPETPLELQRIVTKALKKDREERYQSVKDLALDVKSLRRDIELGLSRAPEYQAFAASEQSGGQSFGRTVSGQTAFSTAEQIQRIVSDKRAAANTGPIIKDKKPWNKWLLASIILTILVGGLAFESYRFFWSKKSAQEFFQQVNVSAFTSDGNARDAVISPDGKYIAFIKGNPGERTLWLRQVSEDSSLQLVPSSGGEFRGVTFSRDSNSVFYTQYDKGATFGSLYQIPILGGTPKKIAFDIDSLPALSPNGKQIAFIRHSDQKGDDSLMIVDNTGANERLLISTKGIPVDFFHYQAIAWSPDGNHITVVGAKGTGGTTEQVKLINVSVKNASAQTLAGPVWWFVNRIAWTPNGQSLIIVAKDAEEKPLQIWEQSFPDGAVRQITNDTNEYQSLSMTQDAQTMVTVKADAFANIWAVSSEDSFRNATQITTGGRNFDGGKGMAWTPDGRIIYTSNNKGAEINLFSISVDGGESKQLTNGAKYNLGPMVSRDGKYLFFASNRAGSFDVWRMNIDGSDLKRLTTDEKLAEFPGDFTSDKKQLYLSQQEAVSHKSTLWRMPLDGGPAERITAVGEHFFISVSPDGKLVAYLKIGLEVNAPTQIIIARMDGKEEPKQITVTQKNFRWMPDSKALCFIDYQNGAGNLWLQPLDSSKPRQITNFKTDRLYNYAWSQDGKRLALSRGTVTSDVVLIKNTQPQ